jgi:hypothetical protein
LNSGLINSENRYAEIYQLAAHDFVAAEIVGARL